ncbi:MAG: Type 1 glutamine amidotransferase-like domain-containing protein [Gaiellaceae bacterium]
MGALKQIVGFGGGGETDEQTARLVDHVASLTRDGRLKVCFVPTAAGEAEDVIEGFLAGPWSRHGELSVARFFPWPRPDLRVHLLGQDVVVVSGGNTANMLAIWRVHGFDTILREAWEAGVVLTGASAGMICWYEAGVTDSFGPQLEGLADGLGFLPGSACPHYDGEAARRPRYSELVAAGFPEGIAADDGVGLHYVGTELERVVSCRPDATAYRVTAGGAEPLAAILL